MSVKRFNLYDQTLPLVRELWSDIHQGKYGTPRNPRRKIAEEYAVAWEKWLTYQQKASFQVRGWKAVALLIPAWAWHSWVFSPKERELRADMEQKQARFAKLKAV